MAKRLKEEILKRQKELLETDEIKYLISNLEKFVLILEQERENIIKLQFNLDDISNYNLTCVQTTDKVIRYKSTGITYSNIAEFTLPFEVVIVLQKASLNFEFFQCKVVRKFFVYLKTSITANVLIYQKEISIKENIFYILKNVQDKDYHIEKHGETVGEFRKKLEKAVLYLSLKTEAKEVKIALEYEKLEEVFGVKTKCTLSSHSYPNDAFTFTINPKGTRYHWYRVHVMDKISKNEKTFIQILGENDFRTTITLKELIYLASKHIEYSNMDEDIDTTLDYEYSTYLLKSYDNILMDIFYRLKIKREFVKIPNTPFQKSYLYMLHTPDYENGDYHVKFYSRHFFENNSILHGIDTYICHNIKYGKDMCKINMVYQVKIATTSDIYLPIYTYSDLCVFMTNINEESNNIIIREYGTFKWTLYDSFKVNSFRNQLASISVDEINLKKNFKDFEISFHPISVYNPVRKQDYLYENFLDAIVSLKDSEEYTLYVKEQKDECDKDNYCKYDGWDYTILLEKKAGDFILNVTKKIDDIPYKTKALYVKNRYNVIVYAGEIEGLEVDTKYMFYDVIGKLEFEDLKTGISCLAYENIPKGYKDMLYAFEKEVSQK